MIIMWIIIVLILVLVIRTISLKSRRYEVDETVIPSINMGKAVKKIYLKLLNLKQSHIMIMKKNRLGGRISGGVK